MTFSYNKTGKLITQKSTDTVINPLWETGVPYEINQMVYFNNAYYFNITGNVDTENPIDDVINWELIPEIEIEVLSFDGDIENIRIMSSNIRWDIDGTFTETLTNKQYYNLSCLTGLIQAGILWSVSGTHTSSGTELSDGDDVNNLFSNFPSPSASQFNLGQSCLIVNSGGTLNLTNREIRYCAPITFNGGSTTNLKKIQFRPVDRSGLATQTSAPNFSFRGAFSLDDCVIPNSAIKFFVSPTLFKAVTLINLQASIISRVQVGGIGTEGIFDINAPVLIGGATYRMEGLPRIKVKNLTRDTDIPSSFLFAFNLNQIDSGQAGIPIFQDVKFIIKDSLGGNIEHSVIGWEDVDSGNRIAKLQFFDRDDDTIKDYVGFTDLLTTRFYSFATGSDGEAPSQEVLTNILYTETADNNRILDIRTTEIQARTIRAYKYIKQNVALALQAGSEVVGEFSLLDDANIISTRAEIIALQRNISLSNLYDSITNLDITNTTFARVGGYDNNSVDIVGTTLQFNNNFNLVFDKPVTDPTAGEQIEYNSSTKTLTIHTNGALNDTINATNKWINITTGGTITTNDDVELNFIYTYTNSSDKTVKNIKIIITPTDIAEAYSLDFTGIKSDGTRENVASNIFHNLKGNQVKYFELITDDYVSVETRVYGAAISDTIETETIANFLQTQAIAPNITSNPLDSWETQFEEQARYVTVTPTNITLRGKLTLSADDADDNTTAWQDIAGGQLIFAIRKAIEVYNQSHTTDLVESNFVAANTETKVIEIKKPFVASTAVVGLTVTRGLFILDDVYTTIIVVDTNSNFLDLSLGVNVETTTKFQVTVSGVQEGDIRGSQVGTGTKNIKIYGVGEITETLTLNKADTTKIEVRRKGFVNNSFSITSSTEDRNLSFIFEAVINLLYSGASGLVIADILNISGTNIQLIKSTFAIGASQTAISQKEINLFYEFDATYPFGVGSPPILKSLINGELALNYGLIGKNEEVFQGIVIELNNNRINAEISSQSFQKTIVLTPTPTSLDNVFVGSVDIQNGTVIRFVSSIDGMVNLTTTATSGLSLNAKEFINDGTVSSIASNFIDISFNFPVSSSQQLALIGKSMAKNTGQIGQFFISSVNDIGLNQEDLRLTLVDSSGNAINYNNFDVPDGVIIYFPLAVNFTIADNYQTSFADDYAQLQVVGLNDLYRMANTIIPVGEDPNNIKWANRGIVAVSGLTELEADVAAVSGKVTTVINQTTNLKIEKTILANSTKYIIRTDLTANQTVAGRIGEVITSTRRELVDILEQSNGDLRIIKLLDKGELEFVPAQGDTIVIYPATYSTDTGVLLQKQFSFDFTAGTFANILFGVRISPLTAPIGSFTGQHSFTVEGITREIYGFYLDKSSTINPLVELITERKSGEGFDSVPFRYILNSKKLNKNLYLELDQSLSTATQLHYFTSLFGADGGDLFNIVDAVSYGINDFTFGYSDNVTNNIQDGQQDIKETIQIDNEFSISFTAKRPEGSSSIIGFDTQGVPYGSTTGQVQFFINGISREILAFYQVLPLDNSVERLFISLEAKDGEVLADLPPQIIVDVESLGASITIPLASLSNNIANYNVDIDKADGTPLFALVNNQNYTSEDFRFVISGRKIINNLSQSGGGTNGAVKQVVDEIKVVVDSNATGISNNTTALGTISGAIGENSTDINNIRIKLDANKVVIDEIKESVDSLEGALIDIYTIQADSTITEIRTNSTKANNFYKDRFIKLGASDEVRKVTAYANTNGAFTVDELATAPVLNDKLYVFSLETSASGGIIDPILIEQKLNLLIKNTKNGIT